MIFTSKSSTFVRRSGFRFTSTFQLPNSFNNEIKEKKKDLFFVLQIFTFTCQKPSKVVTL